MSEQTNPQTSNEIDFIDLIKKIFSGIGSMFSWVKHQIQRLFRLFIKYWWICCLLFVLGGTFGYIKHKVQKDYYETEMLVQTNIVSRFQIVTRINSLQKLIGSDALAKQLSLNIDEANSLFLIKAGIIRAKIEGNPTKTVRKVDKDGVETEVIVAELGPQYIRIYIRLWENENLNKIQNAIIHFIETDPYIQEQTTLSKQANLLRQEAIMLEIEQLKLFQEKNIKKSSLATSGSSSFIVQNEEKTYSTEILTFKNQLLSLRSEYDLIRPLLVIQSFTPVEKPVDKNLVNVVFFAFLFFAIGYIILLAREGWNRI